MLGVQLNQRADKRGLATAWRALHYYHDWWGDGWGFIDTLGTNRLTALIGNVLHLLLDGILTTTVGKGLGVMPLLLPIFILLLLRLSTGGLFLEFLLWLSVNHD